MEGGTRDRIQPEGAGEWGCQGMMAIHQKQDQVMVTKEPKGPSMLLDLGTSWCQA